MHIDVAIFTISTRTARATTISSMTCFDMTFETQVMQSPKTFVSTNYDMTTTTTITSVWSTFFYELFTVQVRRSLSSFSRSDIYFYVINKISFCHILYFSFYK